MPLVAHEHEPIYRVVRAGWPDPLDTIYARSSSSRWNPANSFPVLYTSCSENVARAIVRDLYDLGAIEIDDLQPSLRPQLTEIGWGGTVVDMASVEGIMECGFPLAYPDRIGHELTQPFAPAWHELGAEGIVCRSASVWRMDHVGWNGPHEAWSELAIFIENARRVPRLLRRREDLDWLVPPPASAEL
jgi:RES domain